MSSTVLKQLTFWLLHKVYVDHVNVYADSLLTSTNSTATVVLSRLHPAKVLTSHMTMSTGSELVALLAAVKSAEQGSP